MEDFTELAWLSSHSFFLLPRPSQEVRSPRTELEWTLSCHPVLASGTRGDASLVTTLESTVKAGRGAQPASECAEECAVCIGNDSEVNKGLAQNIPD